MLLTALFNTIAPRMAVLSAIELNKRAMITTYLSPRLNCLQLQASLHKEMPNICFLQIVSDWFSCSGEELT